MAITSDNAILNILKVWYKDSLESLLYRNSPVLKKIDKTRVEGKQQNFAALYSRGGAVAPDFLVAKQKAAENVKNAEFKVTPGQLFSVWNYNAKEVQSSLTKRGAYMKVAGNKAFAATEALRKTLAASLYGRGYGEIGNVSVDGVTFAAGTPVDLKLTEDAIIKLDIGSQIALKAETSGAEAVVCDVNSVDDTNGIVNVTPRAAYTPTATSMVVAIAGSMDSSGNGIMPMGLDAWLPIVNGRDGADWNSYIGTSFFGVNRSVAPDRLAGQFYIGTSTEKKSDTVTNLLRKIRRAGGVPDMIVMNDKDWYSIAKEIETTNTLFTQTSEKGKKKATMGFSDFAAAFSTNWIDNVFDDPYCPQGKFYILDTSALEYFVYTNSEAVNDGIGENNPGKQDPMEFNDKGREDTSYKLLIDDFLTCEPGEATSDGPAVRCTINYFGSLAVTNPASVGVGLFYNADGYDNVLGYKA